MTSNETRLLARLAADRDAKPVTLVNPPESHAVAAAAVAEVISDDYAVYTACSRLANAPPCRFGVPDTAPATEGVVLFLPRARQRLAALIAMLRGHLDDAVELVVIGAKRGGIGGARKVLAAYAQEVRKSDAARHCQALAATLEPGPAMTLSRWFDRHTVSLGELSVSVAGLPGVFASGRLDAGTALLLERLATLPAPADGTARALDFGCGAGILAAALARRGWRVDAVDNDYWALQAAAETLRANALDAHLQAVSGAAALSGRYALVVSNPPFHRGVEQHTGAAETLIARLPMLLQPEGRALVVANRFLPYEDAAARAGLSVETIGGDRGYKLLSLRRSG